MTDFIINLFIYGIPILFAITLHEAAHGYVALACGDDTAKRLGRVTLNPLKHIDPFGTVLLPLTLMLIKAPFLFGYAKPVPVNFNALRNLRLHMIWVALAGPGSNFFLALTSGLLLHVTPLLPAPMDIFLKDMLGFSIVINCLLGLFNFLPILPLDGGRILAGLLPPKLSNHWSKLEPYGLFIIMGLFFILPWILSNFGIKFSPFEYLLKDLVFRASNGIAQLTGHL